MLASICSQGHVPRGQKGKKTMLHLTRTDGSKFYVHKELIRMIQLREGKTKLTLTNGWVVFVKETVPEMGAQLDSQSTVVAHG